MHKRLMRKCLPKIKILRDLKKPCYCKSLLTPLASFLLMKLLIQYRQLSRLEKGTIFISYLLQLSLVAAAGIAIYEQQWLNMFLILGILALTVLPAILRRNYKIILPIEIEVVIVFFIYA